MPMIPVRDTKLYYETAGNGDVSLLMIHGMCGSARNWADQMNRLTPEFTCVAYDRRGHSRSEGGPENQSEQTHADDAAALIEALDLDRPIIVGSSSGAVITFALLRSRPDLVRGAVLLEPPLFGLDPEGGKQMLAEIGPRVQSAAADGGPRAAVDAFFEVACTSFWADLEEDRRNQIRDNAPMLFPQLEQKPKPITPEDLTAIETPVLIIAGGESHPVARDICFTLAEHMPDTRLVDIDGSEHVVYAEKPAEFAGAVRSFVREIAATASPATRT